MNLTSKPEIVNVPATHYVFVEKTGDFHSIAGQAWKSAHAFVPELSMKNKIVGYLSLYKIGPKMYRAGFALEAAPVDLPDGLAYEQLAGGKYAKFVLKGSYSQLPQASQQVWNTVAEKKLPVRDEYAIENYVNNPSVTPEDQLITEILVPTV
jgi:predicted transcriptional regulator YdeE